MDSAVGLQTPVAPGVDEFALAGLAFGAEVVVERSRVLLEQLVHLVADAVSAVGAQQIGQGTSLL